MKTLSTEAIVLRRTNYGEADRIMSLLTADYGKISVIAKGVRKERSKLAGGIELFSISQISFIKGKGDIDTLVSTKLFAHFDKIMRDLATTQTAYDFLSWINSTIESAVDSSYFDLLSQGLRYLNEPRLDVRYVKCWFSMHLLIMTGHEIELQRDTNDDPLREQIKYQFDFESGRFTPSVAGLESNAIKLLRLFRVEKAEKLVGITGSEKVIDQVVELLKNCLKYYLPIRE